MESDFPYNKEIVLAIIRVWPEISEVSDEYLDIDAARKCLDIQDKAVFFWLAGGVNYLTVGELITKEKGEYGKDPWSLGRRVTKRMLRNLMYYLKHPWKTELRYPF